MYIMFCFVFRLHLLFVCSCVYMIAKGTVLAIIKPFFTHTLRMFDNRAEEREPTGPLQCVFVLAAFKKVPAIAW